MFKVFITAGIFLIFFSLFVGLFVLNVGGARRGISSEERPLLAEATTPRLSVTPSPVIPTPSPTAQVKGTISEFIDNQVPFTPQAPLAQWDDPIFKDGCEEASVLMAIYWAQGKSITSPEEATRLIKDISDWQEENYGEFRDRSVVDTFDLIKEYFEYDNIQLYRDITLLDIKEALANKAVVIVPAAGRELNNPHFTPPGPLNHMLVIRGYDPETKEFITNEPGTRYGEGFRYKESVLYNAIRDYPTGYQEPITQIEKNMIVVN